MLMLMLQPCKGALSSDRQARMEISTGALPRSTVCYVYTLGMKRAVNGFKSLALSAISATPLTLPTGKMTYSRLLRYY